MTRAQFALAVRVALALVCTGAGIAAARTGVDVGVTVGAFCGLLAWLSLAVGPD